VFKQTLKGIKVDVSVLVYNYTHKIHCIKLKFRRFNQKNNLRALAIDFDGLVRLSNVQYENDLIVVDSAEINLERVISALQP
jgi:hypothetical protein